MCFLIRKFAEQYKREKGVSYNKDATRGLERLIDNTSTTSAPDSIVQAYEMVRGGNARGKRDHTPSNDVFLHKKGLGHRAS